MTDPKILAGLKEAVAGNSFCVTIDGQRWQRMDKQMPGGAGWKCKARPTADPPQDCGFPFCGCCPDAEGVIEALVESGWVSDAEIARLRAERAELLAVLRGMLVEWDRLTRYGSPMAKAANERIAAARAIIAKMEAPHAD